MEIKDGKIELHRTETVSIRDYLKQLSLDYINAHTEGERLKKEFEARIRVHNELKKEIRTKLKAIKLTAKQIKELQEDRNAYTTMNEAFPKVFKIPEGGI